MAPEALASDRFLVLSDDDLAGLNIPVSSIVDAIEQAVTGAAKGNILTGQNRH